MNVEDRPESVIRLRSELARLCLPAAARDADRGLAWMNSIALLFLVIGIAGARPAVVVLRPLPPARETAAVLIEPVTPPTPEIRTLTPAEEPEEAAPEAAEVVVVTPEAPDIVFAVPTLGQLVVPTAMAAAPPLRPLAPLAPEPTVRRVEAPAPAPLVHTGLGGERPHPPYPTAALERRQQGTVVLLLEVDETGAIREIAVKSSSGSAILDRSTLDFVKRRWKIPPGTGTRLFEATVKYQLEAG